MVIRPTSLGLGIRMGTPSVGIAAPKFAGDFYTHPDALSARLPSFVPRAGGGGGRFIPSGSDWQRRSPHLVRLQRSVNLETSYSDSEKLALGQKLFPAMDELKREALHRFQEIADGRENTGRVAAWLSEQSVWFESLRNCLGRYDLENPTNALLHAFFSSTMQPLFALMVSLGLLYRHSFDRPGLEAAAQDLLNRMKENVELRKKFLVGQNGFLVSDSRHELAWRFIEDLTEGNHTLSWEQDRFVVERPLQPSPFDRPHSAYRLFLPWPIDPAHPLVHPVLETLGWRMAVTTDEEKMVITFHFGASTIIDGERLTVEQWRSFLPASISLWYLALPEKLKKYLNGELDGYAKMGDLGRWSPQVTMALLLSMALKQYFLALGAQELSAEYFEETHPLFFDTIRRINGALEARREALQREVFGEDQFFAALGGGDAAGGRDFFIGMLWNRARAVATHTQNGLAWLEVQRQSLSAKVNGVIMRLHAYLQENAIPEVIGAFLGKEAAEILAQLEALQKMAKDLERLGANPEEPVLKRFFNFDNRLRGRQLTIMMGTFPLLKTENPKVETVIRYLSQVFGADKEVA